LEEYEPSLDWGHELVPSLLWILKYWAGAAVIDRHVQVRADGGLRCN
jgi:putative ATP-binding cassette transporter